MLGSVFMSAALLFFYISYLQGCLAGRASNVRRTYGLAFALVAVYCLRGLFYLSAPNAKHEPVRMEFTRLHPVLRLGVSTLAFLDKTWPAPMPAGKRRVMAGLACQPTATLCIISKAAARPTLWACAPSGRANSEMPW